MPKLTADFSKISSSFEPLPAGDYRLTLEKIEEGTTRENSLPQLSFHCVVEEGDYAGRKLFDNVVLTTKDGKPNAIGLGRVKGYAEAILGQERANGEDIDTDELVGGSFLGVVGVRTYTPKGETDPKTVNELKKVLPVG